MTQEDKELLIKDLSARLPYRVICQCDNIKTQGVLKEIGINYNMCRLYDSFTDEYENCYIFDCKPYLFPLSSMTAEQKEEFNSYFARVPYYGDNIHIPYYFVESLIDFYNKHHLDWRGLIPKGLALDATKLNVY